MENTTHSESSNGLLVFLVGLWIASQFVRIPYMSIIVTCVLLATIIVLCVVLHPHLLRKNSMYALFAFIFVEVIYMLLGKGLPAIQVLWTSLNFMACTTLCFSFYSFSNKQLNFLYWLMTGLLLYSIVLTFIVLLENPMAVRLYGYGIADDASTFDRQTWSYYRSRGMYSYGIGEALAVITPAYLALGVMEERSWRKIVAVFVSIGSTLTQIMASLTTSSLLSIIFVIMTLLSYFNVSKQRKKINATVVILFFAIIGFSLFSFFVSDELMFMLKIDQVEESFETRNAIGSVEGRGFLYMQSIRVFLHNPILGFGDCPVSFGMYTDKMVSMHTAIFDYLGLFGVFALLLYYAWKGAIKSSFEILDKNQKKVYRWCLFSLVLLLAFKGPVTIINTYMFSTVMYGLIIRRNIILCSEGEITKKD